MNQPFRTAGEVPEIVHACAGCGRDVPVLVARCEICERLAQMRAMIMWQSTRVR